ncbi:flagellar biosynthetic protein FliR [Aquicella lusitana]|uniref:Flagellar biosynthetic protein FliR n=1 Tax=Aquicella lusitana TaxID=254246 RepID=A0A370G458_9COXI|nr:flagellar biosynthetic protein FliR [Aquicella lusitana]RDI38535.1 flagellar biosynthetic protein FliR [Aquicella lusitana]VVC74620.1 Flagellar biosynthetic protein FliR [Aquicella lusitana]
MNIISLIPLTYEKLVLFILALARISALLSSFVFFRRDYVNNKIIIGLSSLLAYIAVISMDFKPYYALFSANMVMQIIFQVVIGIVSGLILNIIFEIFTAFGQIISTQIGFSMVTLIDPRFGSITALTLFYNYAAMLIFLLLNGHLIVINLILESFKSLPVSLNYISNDVLIGILKYANIIFTGGVSLSIAIIIAMLITNMTIAVMSRFAPQFNIFSVGINISIILGLIFVFLTFGVFVGNGVEYIGSGLKQFQLWLTGG